jgi:hypothetical protein
MKTKLFLIAALIAAGITNITAQITNTNPPANASQGFSIDALLQNGIANGGVYVTAGRKLTGDVSVVGFGYLYNMTSGTNGAAGLIAGYDQLIYKGGKSANVIKGGLNLNAIVHPFTGLGWDIALTPYVAVLIATPTGGTANNGGIGQITDTGIGIPLHTFKSLTLYLTPSYENRVGEGSCSGNYGMLGLTIK